MGKRILVIMKRRLAGGNFSTKGPAKDWKPERPVHVRWHEERYTRGDPKITGTDLLRMRAF
jgi:hypothetical protein